MRREIKQNTKTILLLLSELDSMYIVTKGFFLVMILASIEIATSQESLDPLADQAPLERLQVNE